MAIDINRFKTKSNLGVFLNLVISTCRKFTAILLIILSFNLVYFGSPNIINIYSLELTGKIIVTGIKFYDCILNPINLLISKLSRLNNLDKENIELKLELTKLKTYEINYQILKAENESLRSKFKIVPDDKYNYIKARLLSISLNPFSKTILIGAGEKHGVKIDQVVANEDGLIGRVINISKNYSKVMLINDPNSRIPIITSSTHQRAILEGSDNKLNLTYLSNNNDIMDQEIIITSGDGKVYPYGIPIAQIKKESEKKIILNAIVNLNKTQFVNIHEAVK